MRLSPLAPSLMPALVLAAGLALPAAARACPDAGQLAALSAAPEQVADPALLDCALSVLTHSLPYDTLIALQQQRIALARPGDGDGPLDPLRRMTYLAEFLILAGRLDEADAALARSESLLTQVRTQTPMPRMRLLTLAGDLALRRNQPEAAHRALAEAIRLGEGQVSAVLRDARTGLAQLHLNQGRHGPAEAEYRAALALEAALNGSGSRDALRIRTQLALTLSRAGAEPQVILDEALLALNLAETVLGPDDSAWIDLHFVVGEALAITGDLAGAVAHLEFALAIAEARIGPTSRAAAAVMNLLGLVLVVGGDGDEGPRLLARAHRIAHDRLGEWHPLTLRFAVDDAAGLMAAGQVEAGLHQTIVAISRMRAELGETHPELRLAAEFARDEVLHHRPEAPELALLRVLAGG